MGAGASEASNTGAAVPRGVRIRVMGAGAWGLSAALALAERGHDVRLVDPRGVGAGSTAKAAGIVSTMTWNDDDFHLVQQTRGRLGLLMAEAAAEGMPEARVWRSHDSITVAAGAGLERMDEVQERLERLGEEPERFDATTAGATWPAVSFAAGEEVLVAQEDGYVEAGDLATLLAWAAQEAGVHLDVGPARGDHGAAAQALPHAERRAGDAEQADEATVVAAGPWTPRILQAMGVDLPMASFRTQACSLAIEADVPILHDTVHGFYVRPDSSGSILAGDGTVLRPHDPDDFDEAADGAFRDSIAQRVVSRLHQGAEARWRRGWAGLCVGTPDRHPLCGKVPDHDGLFVLAGDNGYGIMRCLAIGRRLADAVDGHEPAITSPSRFRGLSGPWPLREGFAW